MIPDMNLRSLALAPAFALAFALPAAAEKIPLNEISRYLNSLKTVVADFSQVNADGSVTPGKVYIQRPGRVRFEYKGDQTLVLASGVRWRCSTRNRTPARSNIRCPRRR